MEVSKYWLPSPQSNTESTWIISRHKYLYYKSFPRLFALSKWCCQKGVEVKIQTGMAYLKQEKGTKNA